jgi:nicotinate-nucleotide adenylyltransferase
MSKRVALFGGSFDPIHRGHVAIAAAAADAFGLGRVLFAPTGRQPLKPEGAAASFEDRAAMARIASAGDVRFEVSEVDAPRGDGSPNYTVDTLARLREEMPEAELFVIVGVDSFLAMPRWRDPQRLLELAEWVVVSRPGFKLKELAGVAGGEGRVHLLGGVHEDVSATELRERLERGEDCSDVLPAGVMEYIRERDLYGLKDSSR